MNGRCFPQKVGLFPRDRLSFEKLKAPSKLKRDNDCLSFCNLALSSHLIVMCRYPVPGISKHSWISEVEGKGSPAHGECVHG